MELAGEERVGDVRVVDLAGFTGDLAEGDGFHGGHCRGWECARWVGFWDEDGAYGGVMKVIWDGDALVPYHTCFGTGVSEIGGRIMVLPRLKFMVEHNA